MNYVTILDMAFGFSYLMNSAILNLLGKEWVTPGEQEFIVRVHRAIPHHSRLISNSQEASLFYTIVEKAGLLMTRTQGIRFRYQAEAATEEAQQIKAAFLRKEY